MFSNRSLNKRRDTWRFLITDERQVFLRVLRCAISRVDSRIRQMHGVPYNLPCYTRAPRMVQATTATIPAHHTSNYEPKEGSSAFKRLETQMWDMSSAHNGTGGSIARCYIHRRNSLESIICSTCFYLFLVTSNSGKTTTTTLMILYIANTTYHG